MPWARHGARHTRAFEDTIAWLACAASKATICELMRTGWRTIGHIITRVAAEAAAGTDRLAGLRRIGIDEISYRKGHKYLRSVRDFARKEWPLRGSPADASCHGVLRSAGG